MTIFFLNVSSSVVIEVVFEEVFDSILHFLFVVQIFEEHADLDFALQLSHLLESFFLDYFAVVAVQDEFCVPEDSL